MVPFTAVWPVGVGQVPGCGGVDVGGVDVGGVEVGGVVVVGGGVVVGGLEVVVGVVTAPVHAVPFMANVVGTGLLPAQVPLNPNSTVAFVPTEPLYETFVAVTWDPDWTWVAFQICAMVWPAEKVHTRPQPEIGSPTLVRRTLAVNPPGHWVTTV
jgi:hypothetical protein